MRNIAETETVYEHVSGSKDFAVTAAERWSIGMVNKLKRKYPKEVEIIHKNPDGSLLVHFPLEWMRIKPKSKIQLSEI